MIRIGVTLGDPAGIGPEIVAAALADRPELARRCVVFGGRVQLQRAADTMGVRLSPELELVDVDDVVFEPGKPSVASGVAQVKYLEAAVSAWRSGQIMGLATAPISKQWAAQAGFAFPGHTEYLAAASGVSKVAMMFVGRQLAVALATVHVPLRAVAGALSVERLIDTSQLLSAALERDFGCRSPRLGMVGLNPHAGEGGRLGDEEQTLLGPALKQLRSSGMDISGPLVPDAAFRMHLEGKFDGLVAMYHDQALIPIKLVEFEAAVNLTLGLPFVRTSPDHGTAYDIAGQGVARPQSMRCAMERACSILDRRAAASHASS